MKALWSQEATLGGVVERLDLGLLFNSSTPPVRVTTCQNKRACAQDKPRSRAPRLQA